MIKKMRKYILRHEKGVLRALEILPGFFSWNVILFPYWGIFVIPTFVAYFVLFFNIYWFYQSLQIAISSIVSHLKIQSAKIYDWMGDVRGFSDWERVRHIVIIPTYNEVENIEPLIKEIDEVVNKSIVDFEYIIVDDNSPDGTGAVAEKLKERYPVKVIHRSGKFGLGSAVIEGFGASTREYLGVMDADLSHDPDILNNMVKALDECEIVIGSRFAKESNVEQWKWWRKLVSKIGVFFAKLISGAHDPLSGYFILNRSVIDGAQLETVGYKILFEILVKGKWKKIQEFPPWSGCD